MVSISTYISATAGPHSNTVHFKPLHPQPFFSNAAKCQRWKDERQKHHTGWIHQLENLLSFGTLLVPFIFLKKSCNQQKMFGAFQPTPFHHQNHKHFEKKKTTKRFSSTKQKKTVFFSPPPLYHIHRQNAAKPTKSCKVGDKIVNPDGHPYEILERLGHGTFGQARQGAMGVEDMWWAGDRWRTLFGFGMAITYHKCIYDIWYIARHNIFYNWNQCLGLFPFILVIIQVRTEKPY